MYIDKELKFSADQAVTATAASTNLVDFSIARDIGTGENLYLAVVVKTAMAGAGTVVVTIETDDNASFSSATVAQTIGTLGAASAAGTRLVARLQPDLIDEQYVRVKYTVSGTVSAGNVDSMIVETIDSQTNYASGYTVS